MNKHKQFIKDVYNGEFGYMCSDLKETILKNYPDFKESDFKVGDWVVVIKTANGAHCASGLVGKILPNNSKYNNGADTGLILTYRNNSTCRIGKEAKVRKATKEEIEKHLIEEAKRRGFLKNTYYLNINNYTKICKLYSSLKYHEDVDQLTDGFGGSVYIKGQWATTIETITKEEAEKQLGKIII